MQEVCLDATRSREKSAILRDLPEVDTKWVDIWLKQWAQHRADEEAL